MSFTVAYKTTTEIDLNTRQCIESPATAAEPLHGFVHQPPRVLGAAFGDPMGLRTFSGLSRHLFTAMRTRGAIAGMVNTRQIRWSDLLDRSYTFSRGEHMVRPRLSRRWLWKPGTVSKLSGRFDDLLGDFPSADAILQVGTHVYTRSPHPPHYCITDLTVAQAAEAGRFGFDRMTAAELRGAVAAQQQIFDSCRAIFVPTEWAKESVVKDLGQSPGKVIVVGEGASMDAVAPAQHKYLSKNILFVGYEWENKGGPLLYEAFKLVREQLPEATLTVIGCRPPIRDLGVEILGRLRKNVPREYARFTAAFARANCFCLLSELDAYGIVLLEAQLSATPIVALDRGSRREVVKQDRTGLLVQDATPAAVAAAILSILSDPPAAERMGRTGHEYVSTQFTWPAVADRILAHMADDIIRSRYE